MYRHPLTVFRVRCVFVKEGDIAVYKSVTHVSERLLPMCPYDREYPVVVPDHFAPFCKIRTAKIG